MTNRFNELVTDKNGEFLKQAFGPVLEGVLTYDEKGPLEESKITKITVHEPENDFDTCYKFSLSYEYTIDIDVQVENLETGAIVYTDTLQVRLPKFNNNGFIFKTSDRVGQARFRSPFIKADKVSAVYLFNDTLFLRSEPSMGFCFGFNGNEDEVRFFNNNGLEYYSPEDFDYSKSKLHPNARAKLTLMFNRQFGDNLTKDDFYFLKEKASTDEGRALLKMECPLDFEFNDITRVFLQSCRNIGNSKNRRVSRNNSWRKYGKLYASNVQYCINSIFSIGGDWSDINTADETNSLTTEMQADKIYFYNSKGAQMQLDYTASYIGIVCPVDTPETNLISKKNEKAIGASFINGEPYIEVYTKTFEKKTISMIEYYFSKILVSDCINYETKKIKEGPLVCKTGLKSDLVTVDNIDSVTYYDTEPYNRLSLAVSLVPGVNSTDQIKASIGAKMLGQATSCNGSQRAIVYTGTEKLVYDRSDKVIKADEDMRVIEVNPGFISVETANGPKTIEIPEDKRISDGTVQHFTVDVKPGQTIKKGQEMAATGEFKKGEFAPYINLNVAMWNFGGFDYLDGVVLTVHSIKKCAVRRKGTLYLDITNKGKYVFNLQTIKDTFSFGENEDEDMFKNLDEFGLVKIGSKIQSYDILYTIGHSRTARNLVQELLVQANPDDLESQTYQVPEGVIDGTVSGLELQINRKYANNPTVNLLSMHFGKSGYKTYNMNTNEPNIMARIAIYYDYWDIPKIGDKFSNRWASKATISHIITEEEGIPYDEDGNEIDCIMAPESVWKRKNPKQITSLQLGRLGAKAYQEAVNCIANGDYERVRFILSVVNQDDSYKKISNKEVDAIMADVEDLQAFRVRVSSMDYKYTNKVTARMFKQLGYPEKSKIFIPGENKWTRNEVVVGKESMMRLHFIVQDKAKATSGIFSTGDHFIGGYGSSRDAGQKIGDMTTWAIMANNELDVYDYLTNNVGSKFRDEFVNNLAWIGLELKKTETK